MTCCRQYNFYPHWSTDPCLPCRRENSCNLLARGNCHFPCLPYSCWHVGYHLPRAMCYGRHKTVVFSKRTVWPSWRSRTLAPTPFCSMEENWGQQWASMRSVMECNGCYCLLLDLPTCQRGKRLSGCFSPLFSHSLEIAAGILQVFGLWTPCSHLLRTH